MASLTEIAVAGLIGVIGSLAAAEIVAYAPRISKWLIARAARKLPEGDKERYLEEWLAHADDLPGSLNRLRHALGCYLRASRAIQHFRTRPMWQRHLEASYLITRCWAVLLPQHLPRFIRLALKGRWKDIYITVRLAQLMLKVVIREAVYRDADDKQIDAIGRAILKRVKEALGEGHTNVGSQGLGPPQ